MTDRPIHFAGSEDTRAICGSLGHDLVLAVLTSVRAEVNCPDCLGLLAQTDAAFAKAREESR